MKKREIEVNEEYMGGIRYQIREGLIKGNGKQRRDQGRNGRIGGLGREGRRDQQRRRRIEEIGTEVGMMEGGRGWRHEGGAGKDDGRCGKVTAFAFLSRQPSVSHLEFNQSVPFQHSNLGGPVALLHLYFTSPSLTLASTRCYF